MERLNFAWPFVVAICFALIAFNTESIENCDSKFNDSMTSWVSAHKALLRNSDKRNYSIGFKKLLPELIDDLANLDVETCSDDLIKVWQDLLMSAKALYSEHQAQAEIDRQIEQAVGEQKKELALKSVEASSKWAMKRRDFSDKLATAINHTNPNAKLN
ncbi:hypothetical protein [Alteromonas oceanisediminis]|uniref:hypothetical protein n=1 Tax=Alteromonas oceanisediminis TaxID=2836180 RepID=UPI001BDAD212|nr:hypothetical protein [Alteromonas oceanisediminis]MBT0585321.1 hypothetical protein [Alteromonas oceanisediminis]